MKNEAGLFLISAYAPIGNADQKIWNSFIEEPKFGLVENTLVISWLLNATLTHALGFQTNALTTVL